MNSVSRPKTSKPPSTIITVLVVIGLMNVPMAMMTNRTMNIPTHPSLANSNGRLSDGSEPFLKDWAFLMDFLGVRYHSF
jgi:hypothetical protein